MRDLTTPSPYPPGFIEELAATSRPDVARVARRGVALRGRTVRPTAEVATWIARSAMTNRVNGTQARLYLVEELRRLLGIEATHARMRGKLRQADAEWVRCVARDLVGDRAVLS
jgi:hypothetical protein